MTLTWELTGSSGPDFSLVVTQKLGVSFDKVLPHDILADGIGKLSNPAEMSANRIIRRNVITVISNSPRQSDRRACT